MGAVVSFKAWSEEKRIIVWEGHCDNPFHKDKYIVKGECVFCNTEVKAASHPSFDGTRWYG